MAKSKPKIKEGSYGLYDGFDREGDQLPKIVSFTTDVPARIGQEFGYILNIKHARGSVIKFEIDHPGVLDADGEPQLPFTGELYVRSNDYDFFLGDGLWEPLEQMYGLWALTTWLNGVQIAQRVFSVAQPVQAWDDLDSE